MCTKIMLSLPWCFLYYTAHGLCHTLWSKYFIQLFLQLILIIFMVLLPKGLNVHRLFICNKIMHILYWVYLFPCSPCQSLDSWVTSYPVGGSTKVAKWKNHEAEQKIGMYKNVIQTRTSFLWSIFWPNGKVYSLK